MMETVLANIVADKAAWLAQRKQRQPLAEFQAQLQPASRNFYQALNTGQTAFILECKKASPSKGLIRADFNIRELASVYRHYASAISVLTDEKYFQGDFAFLREVSQAASQPVLCKDFIIDPYQIKLARYYQADACLLMLSVLDDQQYRELAAVAHSLNMGVLTEVSNPQEAARAIRLQARVAGINNRDLRDLSIDVNRTRQLAPYFAGKATVISESGIHHHQQVRELSQFADGFLIGSALMAQPDLPTAVRQIMLGENKVCGLTRPQDAQAAWQAGAVYGGLIFAANSPRQIDRAQARQIMLSAPLRYVAVFRDNTLAEVLHTVDSLSASGQALPHPPSSSPSSPSSQSSSPKPFPQLHAIQLHGNEDQPYIDKLYAQLQANQQDSRVQIWKALSVSDTLPARHFRHVDRYVLDNGQGGSGQRFDWSVLDGESLDNCLLAGGLTADNCASAASYACAGLDFNSGVESAPGIKDHAKLNAAFAALRNY